MKNQRNSTIISLLVITAICMGCLGARISFVDNQKKNQELNSLLLLGETYLGELNYVEATTVYDQVLTIDPKNTEAYLGIICSYSELGEKKKAKDLASIGYSITSDTRIEQELEVLQDSIVVCENNGKGQDILPKDALCNESIDAEEKTVVCSESGKLEHKDKTMDPLITPIVTMTDETLDTDTKTHINQEVPMNIETPMNTESPVNTEQSMVTTVPENTTEDTMMMLSQEPDTTSTISSSTELNKEINSTELVQPTIGPSTGQELVTSIADTQVSKEQSQVETSMAPQSPDSEEQVDGLLNDSKVPFIEKSESMIDSKEDTKEDIHEDIEQSLESRVDQITRMALENTISIENFVVEQENWSQVYKQLIISLMEQVTNPSDATLFRLCDINGEGAPELIVSICNIKKPSIASSVLYYIEEEQIKRIVLHDSCLNTMKQGFRSFYDTTTGRIVWIHNYMISNTKDQSLRQSRYWDDAISINTIVFDQGRVEEKSLITLGSYEQPFTIEEENQLNEIYIRYEESSDRMIEFDNTVINNEDSNEVKEKNIDQFFQLYLQ